MTTRLLTILLGLAAVLLLGCYTTGQRSDDDDSSDEDDPADDDDDAADDDDDDVLADDDDAASDDDDASSSNLPAAFGHDGTLFLDANETAKMFGYSDCTETLEGTLLLDAVSLCASCDGTYTGALTYILTECSDQAGDALPAEVTYGFVVVSATQYDVYSEGDPGVWDLFGSAIDNGAGQFVLTRTDPVEASSIPLGTLDSTFRFWPSS
jgi:hypothetical protein